MSARGDCSIFLPDMLTASGTPGHSGAHSQAGPHTGPALWDPQALLLYLIAEIHVPRGVDLRWQQLQRFGPKQGKVRQ